MKVLVKNLHSQEFTIDCNGDDTVKVLKEKIAANNTINEKYDPELLKLLYTGKVMDDEDTVSHYEIKPEGFLVLVRQTPGKPKPPPKKKPNQGFNNPMGGFGLNSMMQSPFGQFGMGQNAFGQDPFQQGGFGQNAFQQGGFGHNAFSQGGFGQTAHQQGGFGQNTYQQGGFGQNTYQQGGFGQTAHVPAAAAANPLADTPPEAFSTPEDREEALQTLVTMGFNRQQSEKALRASFYNLETAIEYITSGNIPTVQAQPVIPQETGPQQPPTGLIGQGNQPNPPAVRQQTGGGMGANLYQMRQMLRENPAQLQVLKQALQTEHPEIVQMIDENPQAFLELLEQAGGDDDRPPAGAGGAGGAGGTGGAGGAGGQGTISVTLSSQEQKIIDRLQEMGFDRNRAIEAFLVCDRNEELTINSLLTSFD